MNKSKNAWWLSYSGVYGWFLYRSKRNVSLNIYQGFGFVNAQEFYIVFPIKEPMDICIQKEMSSIEAKCTKQKNRLYTVWFLSLLICKGIYEI